MIGFYTKGNGSAKISSGYIEVQEQLDPNYPQYVFIRQSDTAESPTACLTAHELPFEFLATQKEKDEIIGKAVVRELPNLKPDQLKFILHYQEILRTGAAAHLHGWFPSGINLCPSGIRLLYNNDFAKGQMTVDVGKGPIQFKLESFSFQCEIAYSGVGQIRFCDQVANPVILRVEQNGTQTTVIRRYVHAKMTLEKLRAHLEVLHKNDGLKLAQYRYYLE